MALLLVLVTAVAEARTPPGPMLDIRDIDRLQAEASANGWPPLDGLAPPDPFLPRLAWRDAALTGVKKEGHARRQATRAERLGDFADARTRWTAIAADPGAAPAGRTEAGLALVRMGLVADPAAARAALEALPPAARAGLPARHLEGRLLLMEGKPAAALALMETLIGPAVRASRLHTRLLMDDLALAAHLAGDDAYAAKMQAMGSRSVAMKIMPPMLQCDPAAGIRPDDRVVLDVAVDALMEIHQATPVWASRPGPMAEQFAQRALDSRAQPDQLVPAEGDFYRQRLMMACGPRDALPVPLIAGDMLAEMSGDGTLRLSSALGGLSPSSDAAAILQRIAEADVPHALRAMLLLVGVQTAGATPDMCGAIVRESARTDPLSLSGRLAFGEALRQCKAREAAADMMAAGALDERLPAQDRRALAAAAVELTTDRSRKESMAAIARLAPDACLLADNLSLAGLSVTEEDFPKPLRVALVEGAQLIAFDRAEDGRIGNVRVLLSQPPLLFDAATVATMMRNHPAPATRDGRAMACTGHVNGFAGN